MELSNMHLFVLRYNKEENVTKWINNLKNSLEKVSIRCVIENEDTVPGDAIYASLKKHVENAENIMAILTNGYLSNPDLTNRLDLAFLHTLGTQSRFIPVISDAVLERDIPFCLKSTHIMTVNFQSDIKDDDIRKIMSAIKTTVCRDIPVQMRKGKRKQDEWKRHAMIIKQEKRNRHAMITDSFQSKFINIFEDGAKEADFTAGCIRKTW